VARSDIIFKTLKALIPNNIENGLNILDAGCGKGAFSFHLARLYPEVQISGFDLDEKTISVNFQNSQTLQLDNLAFFQADIQALNCSERYNLIISVDVFEHIEKDIEGFKNLYEILKPSGQLLVHVPKKDANHFLSRAGGEPILSLERKENYRIYHERPGYQIRELREKLEYAGFQEITIQQTVGGIGKIAYDIFFKLIIGQKRLKYGNLLIYTVLFPFLRLMIFIDAQFETSDGLGLLAIAKRE